MVTARSIHACAFLADFPLLPEGGVSLHGMAGWVSAAGPVVDVGESGLRDGAASPGCWGRGGLRGQGPV